MPREIWLKSRPNATKKNNHKIVKKKNARDDKIKHLIDLSITKWDLLTSHSLWSNTFLHASRTGHKLNYPESICNQFLWRDTIILDTHISSSSWETWKCAKTWSYLWICHIRWFKTFVLLREGLHGEGEMCWCHLWDCCITFKVLHHLSHGGSCADKWMWA